MLWSKNHIIALVIIAVVLWAMHRFSGLKIWHALVVLAIGAYLTASFRPADHRFPVQGPVAVRALTPGWKKEKNT